MDAADTAVGPKELNPRKRKAKPVPPPSLLKSIFSRALLLSKRLDVVKKTVAPNW